MVDTIYFRPTDVASFAFSGCAINSVFINPERQSVSGRTNTDEN